jgi:uncharacterized Zn finger protein (UPF0148 family)
MIQPCQRCRSTRFRRCHDGSLICGTCGQVYLEYREQLGDPDHEFYSSRGSTTSSLSRGRIVLSRVKKPRNIIKKRSEPNEHHNTIRFDDETEYITWAIQELLIQQLQLLMQQYHLPKHFEVN